MNLGGGKVQRFEELIAWEKASELTRGGYIATRVGPFAKDFGVASQIQRASAFDELLSLAEDVSRVAGSLRGSVERGRDNVTQQLALSTQH